MAKRNGKLVAETTREKIYRQLKNEIFSCDIMPTEVLVIDDLAVRFGVSRTPVREALIALANEGLLDAKHHVGFIVTPLDAKEIVETYMLRVLLEKEAVRLATRNIDAEQLADLAALAEEERFPEGRRFHSLIAACSGWGALAEMLEILMDKTSRSRALFVNTLWKKRETLSEDEEWCHRRIYEAIAARDEAHAATCMENHLLQARGRILRAISGTA